MNTLNAIMFTMFSNTGLMGYHINIMPLFDLGVGKIKNKIFNSARFRGIEFR